MLWEAEVIRKRKDPKAKNGGGKKSNTVQTRGSAADAGGRAPGVPKPFKN